MIIINIYRASILQNSSKSKSFTKIAITFFHQNLNFINIYVKNVIKTILLFEKKFLDFFLKTIEKFQRIKILFRYRRNFLNYEI